MIYSVAHMLLKSCRDAPLRLTNKSSRNQDMKIAGLLKAFHLIPRAYSITVEDYPNSVGCLMFLK